MTQTYPTYITYKSRTWKTSVRRNGNIHLTDGEGREDLLSPEVYAIWLRDGLIVPVSESALQTYAKFAPTGFDSRGAFLPKRQDWLLAPVSQNRDSECLTQSNFAQCLDALGGEGDDVEVHRFGHWACGWFEIILIRPDSDATRKAEDIADALADYPVLDEEDFSRREWEEKQEDWNNWARKEFIGKLEKEFGLNDATVNFLDDVVDSDTLHQFCDEHCSDYCPINLRSFRCTRSQLAAFIRAERLKINPPPAFRRFYRLLPIFAE